MSIHSTVDNEIAKKYIVELCEARWKKMTYPCKGCKYRFPINDGANCCIFESIPRDWSRMEGRV